jgi:hypothetical protein
MAMPPARAYGVALLLLAVGGIGLLVAYGLTWVTVDVALLPGSDAAVSAQARTGRELQPAAGAAGWLALASVAGIVATRSWGRSVVAAVGLVAGRAGVGGALAFAVAPPDGSTTGAWLVAVLAGVVVAVATAWTLVRGRSWPSMGRRYERRPATRRQLSAWDAQDLGRDPTDDLVE